MKITANTVYNPNNTRTSFKSKPYITKQAEKILDSNLPDNSILYGKKVVEKIKKYFNTRGRRLTIKTLNEGESFADKFNFTKAINQGHIGTFDEKSGCKKLVAVMKDKKWNEDVVLTAPSSPFGTKAFINAVRSQISTENNKIIKPYK